MKPIHSARSPLSNCSGQGLTEYLILLTLVAVTCIGVVQSLGKQIDRKMETARKKIEEIPLAETGVR